MIKSAAAAAMAACLLLALPPVASAETGRQIAEVIRLGQGLKRALADEPVPTGMEIQRRGFGIIDSKALDASLRQVLDEVIAHSPAGSPPARIHATPDPAFRAYTSPDATIFLAYGVLQSVQSRDELVALVAHEYAHVALGHTKPEKAGELSKMARGVGALYISHRMQGTQLEADMDIVKRYFAYEMAIESVQSGALPKMRRKNETAADLFAVDVVVAAGYNPIAVLDVLSRMSSWEKVQDELFEKTQLRMVDIAKLTEEHIAKGDINAVAQNAVAGGITNAVASTKNAFGRGYRKLKRQHFSAEKRTQAVVKYMRAQYPDAARPDVRPLPWAGDKGVARLFEGIDQTHAFIALLETDADGRTIAQKHNELARSAAANVAYTRYALSLAYNQARGRNESIATMKTELQRSDSLFAMHMLVLDLLAIHGSRADQQAALEASRVALGDPPELLPHTVRVYRRSDKGYKAVQAMSECIGYGDNVLSAACQKEAG